MIDYGSAKSSSSVSESLSSSSSGHGSDSSLDSGSSPGSPGSHGSHGSVTSSVSISSSSSSSSSGSGSMSSSSAPPAPCDCPDDLASAYTVHIPAGSDSSDGGGMIDPPVQYTWEAQDVVVRNDQAWIPMEGPCSWYCPAGVRIMMSIDGGQTWYEMYPDLSLTGGDCVWRIYFFFPFGGHDYDQRKLTGLTPVGSYTGGARVD